jgi:uncharacterized protein
VEYVPRVVDGEVAARLGSAGAVVIDGPKACGKTETARRQAASEVLLDIDLQARQAALIDPELVLSGAVPRLVDEWQTVPALWNHVRRVVDARGAPGQFVLTGSATPADDITRHTGAGRFSRVRMRPMSLFEMGRSSGQVSLRALLDGAASRSEGGPLMLDELVDAAIRGGWPALRDLALDAAALRVRDYLDQIVRTDVVAGDGVRRDPVRVSAVVSSLARNVGTPAPLTRIAADVSGGAAVTDDTVAEYIHALERLMVVEQVPAWNTHLRSRRRLRTTPIRQFVDPSLAVAALRAGEAALRSDLQFFGFVFESMVIRDLRVYAQPLGGEVFSYRDSASREVDAVVDLGDRWAAFEVKLGAGQVDAAARQLLAVAEDVAAGPGGPAALLGVITGGGYGYVRHDGVHVIPIVALGP